MCAAAGGGLWASAGEEPAGSLGVALLGQQYVDDLPVLVDGSVQVPPLAGDLDVGLIDEPSVTGRAPKRAGSVDEQVRCTSIGTGPIAPPAFVWPAVRRWCFTSDVDPHWAGIGASIAAINALVSEASLDVLPARPDERQPLYY
jgi:hypothetical protein